MKTCNGRTAPGTIGKRLKGWLKGTPLLAIPVMFFLRVMRGFYSYRFILKEANPSESGRIYFMDYDGSGDTYITCAYLKARGLLTKDDCFVASGGLSLKVAKLFGFGYYLQLPPKVALTVRMMERFYGQRLKFLQLFYESDYLEYSGLLRRMAGYRGLNFMRLLQVGFEANFGLDYEESLWIQPDIPYTAEELNTLFREYRLPPGRTVLIAPYAGKHDRWNIPISFYTDLAQKLTENGFVVCTNSCNPEREPVIPGTLPILVPHRLIKAFCEKGGYFIGLRSGLCDIISGAAGCRKVIIYGDMPIPSLTASHREFFSLNAMGLCADAIEMDFTGDGRRLIPEICQLFGKRQEE